ncbi:MAG: isoleucine--tRNA ligase [Nanoarchaeota archaeon]|nr:isoleucine--tRNA ligase [Nanoarchaeota archaeon]
MQKNDNKINEKEILDFWGKNKIYKKSVKKNSGGKKFYFMDGPPYATGHIHMGTAMNKILKDIAMRAHRLQRYDVFDRPGYDTHGVPIEFQIEKEIESKSKKDIEKYGVKKFVDKCKEYATKHIGIMNSEFQNLGVWMNWENPYLSLSDDYIEAIWDTFKKADEKNLLYLGKYPVHICPRCETAVAYNEIEYIKQDDASIYVKFPLKKSKNTFLVIFTTTPWTLPGNTGIMVNPEVDYQIIELPNEEKWIIAKDLAGKLMAAIKTEFTIKKEFKGKEMKNWEYENPLAKNLKLKIKNGYKVVLSSRYVTIDEGTGLVHCAPGHGKEDYEVGKENALDMPSPVSIDGNLTEEAGKYAGKKARIVDKEIIEDLMNGGYLAYKINYNHDYPICWRCKTPLLMVSQPQWFLKISSIHEKLLIENEKTNWIPKWMKLRMKAWLEGISDWPISRERYWGTPLPIWVSEDEKEKIVIGSIKELEKLSGKKVKEIHKPGIDEITFEYKGKKMKRVKSVLDVWFDSGVSSWAALGFPSENKNFKKYWPPELNIEGKDQIRGWWNSQLILSEIRFNKKPFDSIIVHGMILDLGKKKMSKSLGNIISPHEIIEKYSRDHLRYYFAKTSKGEDFSFDEKEFSEIQKVFRVLINIHAFINQLEKSKLKLKIEDKWILSKYHSTIKEATESYNSHKYPEAIQKLEKFLVENLSKSYIKIIRERANETYELLNEMLNGVLKLFAPIIPFLTEKIWQDLRENKSAEEESVHLSSWSKADEKSINKKLEEEFEIALQIVERGLSERDKNQIGLKWPLAKATIKLKKDLKLKIELLEIIKKQLNVKEIELKNGEELSVDFDTVMTPELEAEGYAREISRQIQAFRKELGLKKSDWINLQLITDDELKKILEKNAEFIKERTNSKKIVIATDEKLGERFKKNIEFKIKEKRGMIGIADIKPR